MRVGQKTQRVATVPREATAPRAIAMPRAMPQAWWAALLIFVTALVPRVWGLGGFVTVDEAMHWQQRVADFASAIGDGRFAATILTGHPGVTTMWLGTLGLLLERTLLAFGLLMEPAPYLERLALLRLPVALANAAGAALGYMLLRRLLDARVALLAALLWATNPFLIAHSRLLHLDALLATLMTLSLLALIADCMQIADSDGQNILRRHQGQRWKRSSRFNLQFAILSGFFGGLALLTKVPSVLLLPIVGLVTLWGAWHQHGPIATRLVRAMGLLALWLGVAALTMLALWPALWVAPGAALARMVREALANGDSPHGWGNFFWGNPIADPGPLFYPVALALRLGPLTTIGLLIGLLVLAWRIPQGLRVARRARLSTNHTVTALFRRYVQPVEQGRAGTVYLFLSFFSLLFVLVMTLAAKKFDRYLLPIFPALDVLAAAGLVAAARALTGLATHNAQRATRTSITTAPLIVTIALIAQLATLWWQHPYYLAYANPLLGGPAVAVRAIPFGWGEGMDGVASWLNTQPDLADGAVATWFDPTLKPLVRGDVWSVGYLRRGQEQAFNYLVLYLDQVQRRNEPTVIDAYLGQRTPLHTVHIHGLPYAWVYQVPPRFDQTRRVVFGEQVALTGFSLDATGVATGAPLTLSVGLAASEARVPQGGLQLFVHVIGPDGQRYGQIDAQAGDTRWPDEGWHSGRTVVRNLPISLSPAAPPGEYRVMIGLYQPNDGARLAVPVADAADPALDGPNAVALATFRLEK
jgi:4-amino-4-deoxy-L-arabinose transferase-like glycosyltransferase